MDRHLLLYSTNTWLAYAIAERFYRGVHWVWCSPFFNQDNNISVASMPPSAIPAEIYDRLYNDVISGDQHSAWIEKNRVGILKGSLAKKKEGVITNRIEKEIISMVHVADVRSFKPLLYIIPYSKVVNGVKEVPVEQRAHPMSIEYRIKKLPRNAFHALELRRY